MRCHLLHSNPEVGRPEGGWGKPYERSGSGTCRFLSLVEAVLAARGDRWSARGARDEFCRLCVVHKPTVEGFGAPCGGVGDVVR